MASRSPPRGCKALAVFSLVVGIGALIRGINGNVASLVIGVLHLTAAYGLWTGIFWGWYVGIAAYGAGGVRDLWGIQMNPAAGLISVIFAIVIILYLYSKKYHFLDGSAPPDTTEPNSHQIE